MYLPLGLGRAGVEKNQETVGSGPHCATLFTRSFRAADVSESGGRARLLCILGSRVVASIVVREMRPERRQCRG